MNTPSHLIINAALRRVSQEQVAIPATPFLLGAVVPDLALLLLSVGTLLHARLVAQDADIRKIMNEAFSENYFHDPIWIASTQLLHSPTLLSITLVLLWRFRQRPGNWRRGAFWFAVGCLSHSIIDILTHYDDGPVVFWPFEWSYRFHSPVSYWDSRHFGNEFAIFELALDVVLLVYLLLPVMRRRLAQR
ncbi:MAG: metal-dependent hydrolase [Roseiflexaceae bacterium]|nr:metal-dependent hydrolase [Roseiflexaceae bacterium]